MPLSVLERGEDPSLIKVCIAGAQKQASNRQFLNDKEIIAELMGNYPGKAKKISVNVFNKGEEGHHLIVAGDDGGITDDDCKKLFHWSEESNNLEHSEHGQGSRAAASYLTQSVKKKDFCIVSRSTDNKFRGLKFRNNFDDCGHKRVGVDHLDEDICKYLFEEFKTPIDNSVGVSKWICYCNEDTFKKNENEELDVQYDIKMRYSKQIMEKEVEIYCQNEILKIEHQFIENKFSDTLKIWKVKKIITLQDLEKKEYLLFQINNKYYLNDKDYIHYTWPAPVDEDKKKPGFLVDEEKFIKQSVKPLFEFEASMFHPTQEKRQQIAKEYSMTDSKRKKKGGSDRRITQYNGVYYLKKNVLLSTTSMVFPPLRKTGQAPDDIHILAIQPTGNGAKTGIQTLVQKDLSPRLDNEVTNLMKIYYDDYRNSKTTTDTDSTDTVTNNTHNTSSPPPPPSASNDTDSNDAGSDEHLAHQLASVDETAHQPSSSSPPTAEREPKRQRREEHSISQPDSSTQSQLNKKDEYTYFYLFTLINPVTNKVDESWKDDDKPIYKFGRTMQEEYGRLSQHKCHHPRLKIKLLFFSKNKGPPSRETTVKSIAKKKDCLYRDEFLYGDIECIMDIIRGELLEETHADKPYTQDELDKIMDEKYLNRRFSV
tara:strand:- start:1203 stop:3161 length:1959 start_codon:yes stop_codon:yes gene_type:complete